MHKPDPNEGQHGAGQHQVGRGGDTQKGDTTSVPPAAVSKPALVQERIRAQPARPPQPAAENSSPSRRAKASRSPSPARPHSTAKAGDANANANAARAAAVLATLGAAKSETPHAHDQADARRCAASKCTAKRWEQARRRPLPQLNTCSYAVTLLPHMRTQVKVC